MTEFVTAWKMFQEAGALRYLVFLMFLYLLRRYVFAGVGIFLAESFSAIIAARRSKLEVEIQIRDGLRDVGEKVVLLSEGLWSDRNTGKEILVKIDEILALCRTLK